jgi:hypothetical protein
VAVSFIGGENWKKPLTCRTSLTKILSQNAVLSAPRIQQSIVIVFAGVQCDIDEVIRENRELKSQLNSCMVALDLHKWSLDRIRGSGAKTKFYTGLPTFAIFMWLYK